MCPQTPFDALQRFSSAQESMVNDWSESDAEKRKELWRELHTTGAVVRHYLSMGFYDKIRGE